MCCRLAILYANSSIAGGCFRANSHCDTLRSRDFLTVRAAASKFGSPAITLRHTRASSVGRLSAAAVFESLCWKGNEALTRALRIELAKRSRALGKRARLPIHPARSQAVILQFSLRILLWNPCAELPAGCAAAACSCTHVQIATLRHARRVRARTRCCSAL